MPPSDMRGKMGPPKPVAGAQPVAPKKQAAAQGMEFMVAFYIFLVPALLAAAFAPIQDCDEVFNYWEPTHYINHGYGLETWEYSPQYAIRSWAYASIHSAIIWFGSWLPMVSSKSAEFYFLRVFFAAFCAFCEARMFSVIQRTLHPRVGIIFMIIMASSTGMFHSSTAYLPSSFAMYMTMLGMSAFMDWRGGLRTAQGIMWFGLGALLGWPFAGILVLPFVAEEAFFATITDDVYETVRRVLDGTTRSVIVLALQAGLDVFFYKKPICVPWNIVKYNVFGGAGKGPNIFGTEPWHFYLRNLVLNFNFWLFFALAAAPALILHKRIGSQAATRQSFIRNVVLISPLYLWLAIFTVQPHKEERFMYPVYPLIAFNAAMSMHMILQWLGNVPADSIVGRIPPKIRLGALVLLVLLSFDISILRSIGLATAYSAPLRVFDPLKEPGMATPGDTVCLGKEWYRFPSSYFLPNGLRAKFIRSEFKGLLPGEFSEANIGFGFFPGAWLEPPGMNDENLEDPGKYTDIERCSYLVDSHIPGNAPTALEPDYANDIATWEKLSCKPFLDTANTGLLGRTLWIPGDRLVPEKYRRKWGEFCLLRRKRA